MGTIGDYWRDSRERAEKQMEKQAHNRASSMHMLKKAGIGFERVDYAGKHLVVSHNGRTFDFWPGTGKWTERGTGKSSRGVRELIEELREE